ncbi:MAG: PEP-CTERM sorting domain-containing protein [Pirellulales bacterium]
MNQTSPFFLRSRNLLICAMPCFAMSITVAGAVAAPIVFVHGGSGSGSIGEIPFPDADFTITAVGDTENREDHGAGYFIDHDMASISIDGVGTFDFLSPTRTFVNNDLSLAGFSRASVSGLDLFNGPTDAALATWEMLDDIGPLTGLGNLAQWDDSDVLTTGGVLFFDPSESFATFQATVVPEPSTFWMVAIGLAGLLCLVVRERWRRPVV